MEFIVEDRGDCIVLRPRQKRGTLQWRDLIGCVNYRGPRKTVKEMDEAVAAEALRHK